MKFLQHYNQNFYLLGKRFVFQQEAAPKPVDLGPEGMKGPEKQGEAPLVSEVAPQSPGEIVSNAMGAMTKTQGRYTQGVQSLAGLMPKTGDDSGASATAAGTTASTATTAPKQETGTAPGETNRK
jgi:hypothetical protein